MPTVSLAEVSPALALGPLDGRYRKDTADLIDHLSEAALNRNRIVVEVEWFIHLAQNSVIPGVRSLSADEVARLRAFAEGFDAETISTLAAHEAVTVHDVKAVEYTIKEALVEIGAEDLSELVHFCCTSEDINNLSWALGIKGATEQVWLPRARALIDSLADIAEELAETPLLSHTHGQPATPSTMGKEIAVFVHRLRRQYERIRNTEYLGKINGATGTYSAHLAAVPGADWPTLARTFVECSLGLTFNPLTTQIESHDWNAELFADIARFNRIAHNLATDMWTYISMNYFKQIPVAGATGSSTMPHKVNPIRFENAEANLELSCALLDSLASTLVTSRMQRDLTDSTSQRNIGVAFGHSVLAMNNLVKGLGQLAVNDAVLAADLDSNWEVLGEAIQSVMRAAGLQGVPGMENPYEKLKELTRGKRIGEDDLREFVAGLGLPEAETERLTELTPAAYTGAAAELARAAVEDWRVAQS
ncbi:adenylosuccinate lyase [Brevibacterium sanguinis]|uniref:Adenylosuccinate lyase n=2 Tax=Brevibacterium TaxID=1696 RepID=A0A366IPD5_9MICO|nr:MULTISPECIES: adenylosuccinate lyase [Brevibacterium]RBP67115.1 adenylosuccinate lyase [Brevibacterium sanguinis]RBP73640.1 adenylosuccinate lyase [Brevibacterium celere]